MRSASLILSVAVLLSFRAIAQVDTSFIYNENMPYGVLDLRLARSSTNFYYLEEGKTFSFRTEAGQRTNTYLHMTAWESAPYEQGALREKTGTSSRFVMNYRLLRPAEFKENVDYPIVFFLHGLQESGNCADESCIHATREYDPNVNSPQAPLDSDFPLYNNDYNLLHGGRNYLNARNRAGERLVGDPELHTRGFPGFALFPQSNNGWSPSEVENALRILRLIMKKYNIDRNRVYINGLSKGGYGSFEALKRAPWLFAAGAMFSPISDANINALNIASTIQHVPLWIFQGGQDLAPLPRDTEERIRRFRDAGLSVRYTYYPNVGHATWNEALEEPDFFSWLLGYTNTQLHAFGGNDAVCGSASEGLQLTMPPGYAEYEWQLNGNTFQTTETNSITVSKSGIYRARYKYHDTGAWTNWSRELDIGLSSPQTPNFVQRGTLHLPDLNGKTEAVLEAVGKHNYYFWYRYEDLVNFEGEVDDTCKVAVIPPAMGSGYFSLKVADFRSCISPSSATRKIFFNGKSPVVHPHPDELNLEAVTPSQVNVSWNDKSDDEHGFEVWRRKVNGSSSSPWEMATITNANTNSFLDKGLMPSSKYEYKVRAVSDDGRSDYFPRIGASKFVETPPDQTPPSAPPGVAGELTDVNTITVHWSRAADDSFIKAYSLYVNGEVKATGLTDTTHVLKDLEVNTNYTFEVEAIDVGNNTGPKSKPVTVSTKLIGLFYKHTTGAWQDLKSVDWSFFEYRGRVPYFDLSPKMQEDFFNFRFDGYLYIDKEGPYQFRISSNDGSRLKLNNSLLIDHDGVHDFTSAESSIKTLSAGPQRITVDFFDFMGTDSLIVEYNGPDTNSEWRVVTFDLLRSSEDGGLGDAAFIVYPNPVVDGNATVLLKNTTGEPVQITITNALGQEVKGYTYEQSATGVFKISGLFVNDGVYIITVAQGGKRSGRRLVCMR
jgi:hypothetical protein